MRSRCYAHLLGHILDESMTLLSHSALSTNGTVHTSPGQRPGTGGRTKNNPYLIPSRLHSRTKGPGVEAGGMVKLDFFKAYAVLGRCPRLVWDGPSALKPNPLIYRFIKAL